MIILLLRKNRRMWFFYRQLFFPVWSSYLLLIEYEFFKKTIIQTSSRFFCSRLSGRPITRKGENTGPAGHPPRLSTDFSEICSHAAGAKKKSLWPQARTHGEGKFKIRLVLLEGLKIAGDCFSAKMG